MSNRVCILLLALVMGLLLPTAVSRALLTLSLAEGVGADTAVAPHNNPIPQGAYLITDWYSQGNQSLHKGAGIISYYNLAVFGQNTCTAFGDPYSPLNSPWAPGPYTYHYRIRIPASYPHNIVRVEIFDPDSINANNPGPFTITRTQAAIAAGLPVTTTASCSTTQRDNCVLDTGELQLVISDALTLADINPYYFWRVDENRGQGTPPGNGNCAETPAYNAGYNTRTLFELLYFAQEPDGAIVRQDLAHYTGQVGDGVRDTGDHSTNRRWVSPGASPSYDQPVFVPADPGSPGDFEIDLTTETPNILVDPDTGDRYLYFNVTAMDGASENSFHIWAGPPIYTATVPGEVNARNLLALNSPGSHSAKGVEVTAVTNLLLNNYYHFPLDIPLTSLSVDYAGSDVNFTVFDIDQGGASPITITLDTIHPGDWSLVFGQPGVPDPDGGVRNCLPGLGNCNNQFVTPPYTITLPTNTDCDYTNPAPQTCTPFYGGMLTARYRSGVLNNTYYDTFLWQVTLPTPPPTTDPTVGCSAFPIIIQEGARSVPQVLYESITGDPAFYPNPAPPYSSYINHRPNVPLLGSAPDGEIVGEGDMFLVQNGSGAGGFSWLRWNQYVLANADTLEHGLTWPGDSRDYWTVAPGQSPPNPPFPHGVYGYIDYNDPTDTFMHIGDWVMANTGAVNSIGVRTALEDHIDLGRVLRLPVYNNFVGTGSNARYQMSGFALFRLAGYQLSASETYLLLEFMRWDESCGQANVALNAVSINGPTVGVANTNYTFTATAVPLYATTPITYVWQIDGHAPITNVNGVMDVVSLSWPITGTYTLTVTAVNPFGDPVTAVHAINIEQLQPDLTVIGPPQLLTPLPVGAGLPVSFTVTITNSGDADVTSQFFVDVFIDPTIVLTTGIPISESSGFTAVPALAVGESVTLTINAPLGFPELPPTHTVYAMVDSLENIAESDETNNVSASLTVTDVRPLLAGVTIFGPALGLTGETYTFTAVVTPTAITDPITYTWYLDGAPTLTMTNGTAVPISLTFPLTGTFDLLVMASHGFNTVTDTHTIVITDTSIVDLAVMGAPHLLTPGWIRPEQPVSFTVTIANMGNVPLTSPIQTDIFLHPAIVLSDSIPITQSQGLVVIEGLAVGETAVLTFTIPPGFPPGSLHQQVYVMVDSLQAIAEADESNNVSLPLDVVVGRPLYLPIVLK
ncbi:MAG: hypothetical protein KF770_07680 [Anaerolineae bacterium]|nr:hypothetical protein [Anaerolineae bacterium]